MTLDRIDNKTNQEQRRELVYWVTIWLWELKKYRAFRLQGSCLYDRRSRSILAELLTGIVVSMVVLSIEKLFMKIKDADVKPV